MKRHIGLAALAICGLMAGLKPAAAQQAFSPAGVADGISVFGTGEMVARPNWVEIDLNVSGKAELTGDAVVKFRDAKKRLVDSLDKLGQKNLSTEERGTSISAGSTLEQQQRIVNGMPQAPGKPQIEVSSTVRVRLKDVREVPPEELVKTIGKLIDVAQDAGVSIGLTQAEIMLRQRTGNYTGQSTNVRFVVADLAEMREKAYEQAVADARARATRLARLSNVKLGPTISVQEISVAGDQAAVPGLPNALQLMMGGAANSGGQESSENPRLSSPVLADVPIQVKLLVRFAIQGPDQATAQK